LIAALYIDPRGPYPKLDGVECWDASRDARTYAGPWPVVAHPPCGPYGRLRHLYEGAEQDCALRAVEQVRAFGGVLEHPARSSLFDRFRPGFLPWPGDFPDPWGGMTIEIHQVEWGHVARKTTWLYVVGTRAFEAPPFPGREPTHWASGGRDATGTRRKQGQAVPAGLKVCSGPQRRRTPIELARYLVRLAESSAKNRSAA
jgi:hypothetical protein